MNANQVRVDLEGIHMRYRDFALGPVTATFGKGVTALLGENGAGKTTLMRIIVGSLRPSGGVITWGGSAPRSGAGYLPQAFEALPSLTVREYLAFVAWSRSTRHARVTGEQVDQALEDVGLTNMATRRVGELSGGMLRRLGVAQSLLGDSSALVLDEPTVGLDPVQRRDLRVLVSELGQRRAVLLSTHLAEDVVAVADRVVVLHRGQMVYEGPVRELCVAGELNATALEEGFLALLQENSGFGNAA